MNGTLKQHRDWAGLSRRELAEMIGVKAQTIYNWETGRSQPKYTDIMKVRKALDLKPTDVIFMQEA